MKKKVFVKRISDILYFPFWYVTNETVVHIMKDADSGLGCFNFCIRKIRSDVSCDFKVTTSRFLMSPVIADDTGSRFDLIDSGEKVNIAESRFTIKEHRGYLCVCSASGDFFNFQVRLPKEALKEYFNVVGLIVKGQEV